MSNRRKTKTTRLALLSRPKCPKCKSRDRDTKEYDDAWLHICRKCRFPIREVK